MTQSHINHAIRVSLLQKKLYHLRCVVATSIQRVITFIKVLMLMTINQNKKSFLCERMHGIILYFKENKEKEKWKIHKFLYS